MNNNEKHIESLLNLFMQGKTTLEQERELRHFFALSHDIPKGWEPYKEMMAYFDDGMPIATESRRNIAHPVWAIIAAAAVAAIILMVVPNLMRSPEIKAPTATQPVIIADVDTVNNSTPQVIAPPKPIIAKVEKTITDKLPAKPTKAQEKQKPRSITSPKAHLDPMEMEREQGEIEQAQQELLADKFMIEQERQEILEEQYAGRAQAYQAQQAIANENPQFIQVVFK